MKRFVTLAVTALALLPLSACGQAADSGGTTSAGGPATALTVADARTTAASGPLRVRGALIFDGELAKLCDALADSYPPQCIDGTTIAEFDESILPPDTNTDGQVRWVDSIELIVTRDGERFRYVSTAATA